MDRLTDDEAALGLRRLRRWPKEALEDAATLPAGEANAIVLAAALLDIRPLPEGVTVDPSPNVLELP